jgi:predicted RNase H-like nuclease (RuvC/YqgF family)
LENQKLLKSNDDNIAALEQSGQIISKLENELKASSNQITTLKKENQDLNSGLSQRDLQLQSLTQELRNHKNSAEVERTTLHQNLKSHEVEVEKVKKSHAVAL